MLTQDQIEEIIGEVTNVLKKGNGDKHKCSWGEAHHIACEFADEIAVHSRKGKFPTKLMLAKAPNETAEELKYRQDAFESVTFPYWIRAEKSLNRIWAQQNYKMQFREDEQKDYFLNAYPMYGNIISFFKSVVTNKKVRDPNAVLVMEFELPVKEKAEGELVIDQSKQIEPYASIYDSCDVLMYEEGDYVLLASEEKSVVEYGGKKKSMGFVYYLYDDINIHRIEQTGKYTDFNFSYSIYYPHKLEYLPAWKLKGTPHKEYGDNPIYESCFSAAVPHLNKALKMDSTLDCSINKVAYPIRTYYESKCSNSSCENGKVLKDDKWENCSTCKGTGKMKFSPMRDVVMAEPGRLDPENQLPFPSFAYVSPDTAILEFAETKIEKDIIRAFTFINIDVSNNAQANGTERSATEIKIDRDEFYTFLLDFSDECFWLLANFINAAIQVRYQTDETVELSPPKVFDLTTPAELTEELAKEGLPQGARKALQVEYFAQRFPQNGNFARVQVIIDLVDAYALKDTMEMTALKTNGVIQMWHWILHEEIGNYIADEMEKDEDFLNKSIEDIKKILYQRAQDEAKNRTPQPASADAIMKDIAEGGGVN